MKAVLLTTLPNLRAYLLKSVLDSEGIVSFMKNETISSVHGAPCFDIDVLVFEEDYERAKEIYEQGFFDSCEEL